MQPHDDEERRLRSVALQNAQAILLARQQAERELAAERERLRITLASIGDAVISTDAEGIVLYLNRAAEALTGWTQEAAAGRPLPDVFHIIDERTRQPAENLALRALREGVVVTLASHTVLIARDGTEKPIDDSAAPILDASGAAVGVVLVFRDVTAHREDLVVRSRLAAIVESSQEAIVSKTLEGVIRTWNQSAERLFGYTAEEAVGQPINLIIPADRQEEEVDILARISRGERVEQFETVRVAKGGRLLNIAVTVSPIRDAEGRIVAASKVARDVTEQKRAAAALQASEQRFRTLTANAPAGILLTDGEGDCLFVNERWCAMTGMVPAEAAGQGWIRALHPDDRERVLHQWFTAIAEGRPLACEFRFRTPQGTVTWIQGNAVGIRDERGQVGELIGICTDITERKAAEVALRDADRQKDEFLALLAHELRNPLAPLRNALQIMHLAPGDTDAGAKAREIMDRQLSHMVRLVDDLFDVSRISRNKMKLRCARVLLAEVVDNAVETARPAIAAARHGLTITLPPEPIYLYADLTRLAQVFGNLLLNSAKYTEPGGHVGLTAIAEGDQVIVAVEDDGLGIPAADLSSIFDIFSQIDRSMERSAGGLGIGLALVKGLVGLHGGTVEAASPGVGKGSIFTVRLPLLQDEAATPATPVLAEPGSAAWQRRILVVDDNRDAAVSMTMMLRMKGHEVRTVHDGLEAVESAAEFRPQLVLMDIEMPRLNGYEATRRIREQPWGREMTIVALSGRGQAADRAMSSEAGCDRHLVKPVGLRDLETLLADLTRSSET
jgi:PAS domain S-box-containing protein